MQATNGRDEHLERNSSYHVIIANPIRISLSPESLDMSWEEQGDVLHKLLSNGVIVACDLKRTKHLAHTIESFPCGAICLKHLVKEALVHVDWDKLEEVLVEQRENLGRLEIISKPIRC